MLLPKVGYKDWHVVTIIVMNLQVVNSDLEHNIIILLLNSMMFDAAMWLVPVSRPMNVMDGFVDLILLFTMTVILIASRELLTCCYVVELIAAHLPNICCLIRLMKFHGEVE